MGLLAPTTSCDGEEELQVQLRSVIITRSKAGATVDEIIDDYRELTGVHLLDRFYTHSALLNYLFGMEGVWCSTDGAHGLMLWFCRTARTKHVVDMIQAQRSPRGGPGGSNYRRYMPRATGAPVNNFQYCYSTAGTQMGGPGTQMGGPGTVESQDLFGDMMPQPQPARPYRVRRAPRAERRHPYTRRSGGQQRSAGWRQSRSDELDFSMYGPSYHRHQLVGDDFFLAIAKWELGFSFDPGHDIDMSGLCISGLTLSEAAKRVEMAPFIADHVLVNVGTVDLLHGRAMIDLIHDFNQLVARFRERNVEPIMTTLTPIANSGGRTTMAERLLKLNEYICRTCPRTIDLWKHFVHADGTVRFECFQPGPRKVSGSIMPHVLWNKLGRQHMLGVLGNEIAAQLTTSEEWRYY
ncbi:AGAP003545-PA [Anopheles gambiae str. PEST]|uniref:AGAP003545-PA n=1 Tax=Anopheles gambiae TaxID=7165 RepID=Q7PQJ3_ANOGA|nr:OSKAR [Anopheles gambiae]EAA08754.4 AGAP003545-PA [Anopheles gambiae str. PEST]